MSLKATGCIFRRSLCYAVRCSSGNVGRYSSNPPNKQEHSSKFIPPAESKHDWIDPPDRLSNLRPIIYQIPENETELGKQLRNLRQETEDWNHAFWANQNLTFNKKKEDFILSKLKEKGITDRDEKGRKRTLNSEEMAVFYKRFLDENHVRHNSYNKEWYRRNFTITLLMGRVAFHDLWRMFDEIRGRRKR
ncbi:hypothetical protein DPEC_G00293570 [Dallia pectoralis]|uniref:Uncharacterized protein n=1 Tax=Dallia pectoralis TaxID=75939 RepID=A0ACC2FIA5_DALPE|nr:hypothetical protein DPEC_G00293570 [Dallia pectoralis]